MEEEEAGEPTGEVRVVQYWTEEHRSGFKDFNLTTKKNDKASIVILFVSKGVKST
jgi:hypothetical protein